MSKHFFASIAFSLVLVLGTSMGWYYYYDAKLQALDEQQRAAYDTLRSGLEKQNKALIELGENLQEYIETRSSALQQQLGSAITDVQKDLLQTQEETSSAFQAVTGRIVSVESQSAAALSDLQEKITKIQISSNDFTALIPQVMPAVVAIRTDRSTGSGFVIDGRGYIVTNAHVVKDVEAINVFTFNQEVFAAQIVGSDAAIDLAVLKIDKEMPALSLGSRVDAGERVIAIGSPGGLDFTVTEGIVSGLRQKENAYYVQHDVPVNPGNSGGPLINAAGKVVGINTLKLKDMEGIGFAVFSASAEPVVRGMVSS